MIRFYFELPSIILRLLWHFLFISSVANICFKSMSIFWKKRTVIPQSEIYLFPKTLSWSRVNQICFYCELPFDCFEIAWHPLSCIIISSIANVCFKSKSILKKSNPDSLSIYFFYKKNSWSRVNLIRFYFEFALWLFCDTPCLFYFIDCEYLFQIEVYF